MEALQHVSIEVPAERNSPVVARSSRAPETETLLAPWTNSPSKRAFDFTVALFGLLLLWPIIALSALAMACTSDGDPIFRQTRLGRGHQVFTMYKIRTMCEGADLVGPSVTCGNDRRITRVGRALRRMKLDELPQLINVLRGDMSLVGPRPKLPEHECMRMVCRPGITGAATLLFTREEELLASVPADLVEQYTVEVLNPVKARLDLRYAQRGGFGTDVKLLVATLFRIGWDRSVADLADLVEVDSFATGD